MHAKEIKNNNKSIIKYNGLGPKTWHLPNISAKYGMSNRDVHMRVLPMNKTV
jgi:hypothetical protein